MCENVTTRSETALSFYFSGIPFCYTGIILVSVRPIQRIRHTILTLTVHRGQLLSETERLRIYAGAPRGSSGTEFHRRISEFCASQYLGVAGRAITSNERAKVRKQLTGWVQTQDACLAVWAALQCKISLGIHEN